MSKLNERFPTRTLAAIVVAALTLPVLGASAAHADTGMESGQVQLSWSSVVKYRNLDPADSRHRQILLKRVESEARKLCNGGMVRSDRRACEKALLAKSMQTASEPVRNALALAQAERNGVAQAMR
jgi:UrcA family protein